MTENTLENRLQFFAQYYGQEVAVIPGLLRTTLTKTRIDSSYRDYLKLPTLLSIQYLELTPLSSITDEDAVEVDKICRFSYSKFPEFIGKEIRNWLIFNGTGLGNTSHKWDFLKAADYLRSRGYLIQWRDLTPDQLISYGWVKVKN